jgi:membrane protease YdiL (CAAX protease family)
VIAAMPILAQADAAGLTPLEYDLLQRAGLIGSIYGALVLIGLLVNLVVALRLRGRPLPLRSGMNRLLLRPWRTGEVALVLGVLAIGFVSALALREFWLARTASLPLAPASRLVLLKSALFHLLGLAAVAALMGRRRISVGEGFGVRLAAVPGDVLKGLFGLLAALPALLVLTVLFHLVLHLLGHQTSLQDVAFAISDEKQRWMRAYFVLLAVGLAPVFEEILFRGMLLPVLARRYGGWAAVLLTSFLFAVIHGHLPSFLTLFALSGALSLAYILSGSVVVPIAMHAFFNGITTAILLSLS